MHLDAQAFLPSTLAVGRYRVTMICDCVVQCPDELILSRDHASEWRELIEIVDGQVTLPVNCCLIRSAERCILLDAGEGPGAAAPGSPDGRLLPQLAAEGVDPEDVDTVVITHVHADHINGMVELDGSRRRPTFRNARHLIGATELASTREPLSEDSLPADRIAHLTETRETFGVLLDAGVVEPIPDDALIAPGISFLPSPGHTLGHTSILVEDDGKAFVFLADAVHYDFEFGRPHLSSKYDADPRQLVESKKTIGGIARMRGAVVAASHFDRPYLAFATRDSTNLVAANP